MKKLLAIGEALIDFIPEQTGCRLKEVESFSPNVGGAPANVCGVFSKLGGESEMITQLGDDAFGDKIVGELEKYGIGCDKILRTDKANTCLAFVSLREDGGRDFSFYRKPSADMLYDPANIRPEWFENCFALHFCSVSLGEYPMKEAHLRAIDCAAKSGALISFDPNIRLQLWEDKELLRRTVNEFLPYANILKISDEELEFITGTNDIEKAKDILLRGAAELLIYTKGSGGAEAYTKTASAASPCADAAAIDTTGAGDAFIGACLHKLAAWDTTPENVAALDQDRLKEILDFANSYCGISVTRCGALPSYPDLSELSSR